MSTDPEVLLDTPAPTTVCCVLKCYKEAEAAQLERRQDYGTHSSFPKQHRQKLKGWQKNRKRK